jgi:2,3-bisphosphoglycerate-dependent phosphoglycerate mutase
MKRLFPLLIFFCASASAQTTFILIRHAEKENTANDPGLSKEGEERAQALVKMFGQQKIDAIYSTNFSRTKNTVKPIADAKGITIQIYEKEPAINKLTGTVVICGHSNTIPALANKLIGKDQFKTFEDSDYGNILIITGNSVTHLRF